MSRAVFLDSGPLGLVTNPKASPENLECKEWLNRLLSNDARIVIPEICDYEVRRELIRARRFRGIQRLNKLKNLVEYLPITTEVMIKAAELWAKARNEGYPTADNKALDGDVILAAQAISISDQREDVIIVTTNIRHLSHFCIAENWQNIGFA